MITGTHVNCPECGEKVYRGIFNMVEHHKEKHGLGELTNSLIKVREEKGSPLTEEDLNNLKKK